MAAIIYFKYASKSRPEFFFRGLDSIVNSLANKEDYHVQCTFDVDDSAYNNPAFIDRLKQYKNVSYYFGISYGKINAINRDLGFAPPFDILVNMSDDMQFLLPGFDNIIRADMEALGGTDWFLHYPDSHAKERLATLSIIGKEYFDRDGFIYHPEFKNVYCDNYAQDLAQHRGRYHFFNKTIFDHFHPCWGMAHIDDQYKISENPEAYAYDHAVYLKLKKELQ